MLQPTPEPLILRKPGAAPPGLLVFPTLPTSPPSPSLIYLTPGELAANQEFMQTTAKELVPASNGLLPWHPDTELQATGMHSAAKKLKFKKALKSNFSNSFTTFGFLVCFLFFFQPDEVGLGSYKTQISNQPIHLSRSIGIPRHQGEAVLDPKLNP